MDGNGRWATKRGLARKFGHAKGAEAFRSTVEYCIELGIDAATFYAFSTENWRRPADEVEALMQMIEKYLDEFISKLKKYDVTVHFIGDVLKFTDSMKLKMSKIENDTKHGRMCINIAMNYGGRDEIVVAVNRALKKYPGSEITAEMIESELYTKNSKDPDLIIRTAGEIRISNFLLWQCAYSEFWFTDTLWPDFNKKTLDAAIRDYSGRKRNFGGI